MERKRIHISNFPPGTMEEELLEHIKEYFIVSSLELKERPNGYVFAFADIEDSSGAIQESLKNSKVRINGCKLKLRLAKESFLQKLQKEQAQKKLITEQCEIIGNECKKSIELSSFNDGKRRPVMFAGTKFYYSEINNSSVAENNIYNENHNLIENNSNVYNKETKESHTKRCQPDLFTKICVPRDIKNKEADGKRLKSVQEKQRLYLEQKKAIKLGLDYNNQSKRPNKKIIFDEDYDTLNSHINLCANNDAENKILFKNDLPTLSLFSDKSDDEDAADTDFRIKPQFEGEKGRKLLELQARYPNDERFNLDERFCEDDNDGSNDHDYDEASDDKKIGENCNGDEKSRALHVLESILGEEVISDDIKKSKYILVQKMLHYDPTRFDHNIYECKKEVQNPAKEGKARRGKDLFVDDASENHCDSKVSKVKYYKVDESLKEVLQNKNEKFSLLEIFGEPEEKVTAEFSTEVEKPLTRKTIKLTPNPFKYDSSDTENEEIEEKDISKSMEVQCSNNLLNETLFFKCDDKRFAEGVEFIKSKNDSYITEFPTLKGELKNIAQFKIRNNRKKNKAITRKLGGKR